MCGHVCHTVNMCNTLTGNVFPSSYNMGSLNIICEKAFFKVSIFGMMEGNLYSYHLLLQLMDSVTLTSDQRQIFTKKYK